MNINANKKEKYGFRFFVTMSLLLLLSIVVGCVVFLNSQSRQIAGLEKRLQEQSVAIANLTAVVQQQSEITKALQQEMKKISGAVTKNDQGVNQLNKKVKQFSNPVRIVLYDYSGGKKNK